MPPQFLIMILVPILNRQAVIEGGESNFGFGAMEKTVFVLGEKLPCRTTSARLEERGKSA